MVGWFGWLIGLVVVALFVFTLFYCGWLGGLLSVRLQRIITEDVEVGLMWGGGEWGEVGSDELELAVIVGQCCGECWVGGVSGFEWVYDVYLFRTMQPSSAKV